MVVSVLRWFGVLCCGLEKTRGRQERQERRGVGMVFFMADVLKWTDRVYSSQRPPRSGAKDSLHKESQEDERRCCSAMRTLRPDGWSGLTTEGGLLHWVVLYTAIGM